ncbi:MAG TPA: hypothetical protein VIU37_00245 [Candidatus Limnocylindrales bacterium]
MTTPVSGPEPDASTEPPASPPVDDRAGASYFTIEGRQAPALFVTGWLASIVGVVIIAIGVSADRGLASALALLGGLLLVSIGLVAAAGSQGIDRRARGMTGYAGPPRKQAPCARETKSTSQRGVDHAKPRSGSLINVGANG